MRFITDEISRMKLVEVERGIDDDDYVIYEEVERVLSLCGMTHYYYNCSRSVCLWLMRRR